MHGDNKINMMMSVTGLIVPIHRGDTVV